ncbi:hypothetical protein ACHAXS_009228 [Conticribra weissflogii]
MVNNTMLKALNTIARKQDKPTKLVKKWCNQLLDYAATYPDPKIRYWAGDMILKSHSDSSYNNKENARSSFGRYHWLGWKQSVTENITLNGAIEVTVNLLKLVAASAAELTMERMAAAAA